MGEYLITARSVTHAQRMAQALAQNGFRAVIGRAPVGLTGSGCGYVLRVQEKRAVEAAALLHVWDLRLRGCFAAQKTDIARWKYDLF